MAKAQIVILNNARVSLDYNQNVSNKEEECFDVINYYKSHKQWRGSRPLSTARRFYSIWPLLAPFGGPFPPLGRVASILAHFGRIYGVFVVTVGNSGGNLANSAMNVGMDCKSLGLRSLHARAKKEVVTT